MRYGPDDSVVPGLAGLEQAVRQLFFGSFIVSDIGSFGLTTGMAALFPAAKIPAVIIMGKMEQKPVVRDGEIVIRTILPLTGTFDHRIVDGMQIGKLGRAIHRNFARPEWLNEVPEKELADGLYRARYRPEPPH